MGIFDETVVTMKQGHLLPHPFAPSRDTMVRWCNDGVKVLMHPDKPSVVLESEQRAGDLYTSVEAYHRWNEELNRLRREGRRLRRERDNAGSNTR